VQVRMGRIFVLHLTIILGMFAMLATKSPFAILYTLIAFKTLWELATTRSGQAKAAALHASMATQDAQAQALAPFDIHVPRLPPSALPAVGNGLDLSEGIILGSEAFRETGHVERTYLRFDQYAFREKHSDLFVGKGEQAGVGGEFELNPAREAFADIGIGFPAEAEEGDGRLGMGVDDQEAECKGAGKQGFQDGLHPFRYRCFHCRTLTQETQGGLPLDPGPRTAAVS